MIFPKHNAWLNFTGYHPLCPPKATPRKSQALRTQGWGVVWSGLALGKEARKLSKLKEQYPVTAHAPNFDFWTGCREIKRCEESKRTLKNPFASRLAEFNTTLKLLRITDQWYIVPVKFRFGRNRDFLALLLLPLAGGPKDGKHFDADWRLISSASFHTSPLQIIVKGIRRNETAINAVRKKPLRHWCGWGDLMQLSFVKQNLL